MSAKVSSSRFKRDIDRFIQHGQSSRFIAKWLAQRGETISHVTISSYRSSAINQSVGVGRQSTQPRVVSSESNLTQELLNKAIENLDNPTAVKNYLESYIKMSDKAPTQESEPRPAVDMSAEVNSLRTGQPTTKMKKFIFDMFCLLHPVWREGAAPTQEVQRDYRRWKRVLNSTLNPLLEGRNPLEGA